TDCRLQECSPRVSALRAWLLRRPRDGAAAVSSDSIGRRIPDCAGAPDCEDEDGAPKFHACTVGLRDAPRTGERGPFGPAAPIGTRLATLRRLKSRERSMDQVTTLVTPGQYGRYDAFGVLIEFLTPPDGEGGYCLMRGTIPPRGAVPLHGHPDDESFLLLSGAIQGLVERDGTFEWFDIPPGGCVHVPANAKHAWRNVGDEPVVQLLVTTTRLGRFFREACRPLA